MNAPVPVPHFDELDDDRDAALRRLDADLRAVARAASNAQSDLPATLETLRRRIVAVYRVALIRATGVPHDRIWTLLAATVATFVAYVSDVDERDSAAQAAERRLRILASD